MDEERRVDGLPRRSKASILCTTIVYTINFPSETNAKRKPVNSARKLIIRYFIKIVRFDRLVIDMLCNVSSNLCIHHNYLKYFSCSHRKIPTNVNEIIKNNK